ncbi:MAG TPA: archaeosine biosynthesis radical SAM protein RaSEA [Nanoarchaeota archaeon]|nr:archaeosine biosynthesis radical SAM protein RaSEA [Nanoarchaeota archaeon]
MKTKVAYEKTEGERQIIVLKTNGCSYGKCSMCGFFKHCARNVTSADLAAQFDGAIKEGVKELHLLGSGSFFDDKEVPEEFQRYVFERINEEKALKRIILESRPEYITEKKLEMIKAKAVGKEVCIAIGLESRNNRIRNKVLKKGIGIGAFEKVAERMAQYGIGLQAYILVNPPGLTEKDAVEDAVRTAEYVFCMGKKLGAKVKAAFQPAFIARDTDLEKLFEAGKYKLINLWAVLEIIKRTHKMGNISAGLDTEGLADYYPKGCARCDAAIREAITAFNATQDIEVINKIACGCSKGEKNA